MPTLWQFFALPLFLFGSLSSAFAQDNLNWQFSPKNITIQIGEDRPLQLLDANAREILGANWSVDSPDLADVESTYDGRVTVHPKTAGTVRVTATWNGETRSEEIHIWSPGTRLPPGTTRWSVESLGRGIKELPAVPTANAPHLYSLEQNEQGDSYLRAFSEDGIQLWIWPLPEHVTSVELVCGDWTGGALISANQVASFTLYAVGLDGKLRWQHAFSGVRKGHAINLDHLVHVLRQNADGTDSTLVGLDEVTGRQKFDLPLPSSHETLVNFRRIGPKETICAAGDVSGPIRTLTTQLTVNMDGLAYLAFSQNDWVLKASRCQPGDKLLPQNISFARDEKLILWQVRPDGTVRSTIVDALRATTPLSDPVSVISPTGTIMTDNLNGVLLPARWTHNIIPEGVNDPADEFVYRINPEGEVVFKFPMPKYSGTLHDEMVIGENDTAFATRGGALIAFNLHSGAEVWVWRSTASEISVYAALANGACMVKTPIGLAEVNDGAVTREIPTHGEPVLDWQGNFFQSSR